MENTACATTTHSPHFSPLLSFPHCRQNKPPVTVAAVPTQGPSASLALSSFSTDLPASHPTLWPCAAARNYSENELRFAGG